jgi:hypothetical protein
VGWWWWAAGGRRAPLPCQVPDAAQGALTPAARLPPACRPQDFREPLYLLERPVVLQDGRTEEERKYPELFRWAPRAATLRPLPAWQRCMGGPGHSGPRGRQRCTGCRVRLPHAAPCTLAQDQADEGGVARARPRQHGAHPRGQHAQGRRLPHLGHGQRVTGRQRPGTATAAASAACLATRFQHLQGPSNPVLQHRANRNKKIVRPA